MNQVERNGKQTSKPMDEPEGRSFAQRYGAALGSLALGLLLLGVIWASGEAELALSAFAVMAVLAVVQAVAGHYGKLRALRAEYDEREDVLGLRAFQVSGLVTGAALLALWVRDILNGEIGSQAQWLLALMGASYGLALAYFHIRGR